jgi:hypothetical protein
LMVVIRKKAATKKSFANMITVILLLTGQEWFINLHCEVIIHTFSYIHLFISVVLPIVIGLCYIRCARLAYHYFSTLFYLAIHSSAHYTFSIFCILETFNNNRHNKLDIFYHSFHFDNTCHNLFEVWLNDIQFSHYKQRWITNPYLVCNRADSIYCSLCTKLTKKTHSINRCQVNL